MHRGMMCPTEPPHRSSVLTGVAERMVSIDPSHRSAHLAWLPDKASALHESVHEIDGLILDRMRGGPLSHVAGMVAPEPPRTFQSTGSRRTGAPMRQLVTRSVVLAATFRVPPRHSAILLLDTYAHKCIIHLVLTLIEAAEELGLSPSTLRHQIKNGKLHARKIGRDWYLIRDEVERYRRDNKKAEASA